MDNSDLITRFQSEWFFFDNSAIDQNISTRDQAMKKITSIFMILGQIDVDTFSSASFIDDSMCFSHKM